MLKNYLKTAIRNFSKQKVYTFINIAGLAIGLACSILILLWVQDELQVDRFHVKSSQLYKVVRNAYFSDGQIFTWDAIPKPLAQALEDKFPEILEAELFTWDEEMLISNGEDSYKENGRHAGKDFFQIFSYPFLQGNPATALDDISSIVISETLAQKYFGNQSAIGQTLKINNAEDVKVTGVFQDVPKNSSIKFDFILPIEAFIKHNSWVEHWGNNGLRMFVLLHEDADINQINAKIKNVIKENLEEANSEIFLQPYADMHLYSEFKDGKLVGGRIEYIHIFVVVAIFILIIASINFMNLATARSSKRAKEVGVRKAIGANKTSLIWQFMSESAVIVFFALILAIVLVEISLPFFNDLTSKEIAVDYINPAFLLGLLAVALFTGLLSGSYPALFLSSFNVVKVLKGTLKHGTGAVIFRKGLVVFQFAASILLIIGTVVVYNQIQYIQNKNIGLDKENLAYMTLEGNLKKQYEIFKNELLKKPGIVNVTATSQNPISVGNSTTDPTWNGKTPDDNILFSIINTDYDFIYTMGMEIVAGRDFSREFSTDTSNYVINEEAARAMRMDNPVGEDLEFWEQEGKIIGVVKNFHYSSLHENIGPLIIRLAPEETYFVYIRTEAGKTPEALAGVENLSKEINPAFPFEYHFLDQTFEETYKSEMVIGKLANAFAVMAILISCLGLLGLASFTAEQRTKEIGVRKVLGASVPNLIFLLSSDFTKLVVIGFLLAAPIAYYFMNEWLQGFAYHIELTIGIFVFAGLAVLLAAWLTVSYQSIKAAMTNPVNSLRSE